VAQDEAIVRLEGVYKRYPRADALRGVDLSVRRGIVLGLVGPNGAGKSTLIKVIAGLVFPDRGRVLVEGAPPSHRTADLVAYTPETDHLYPWMTVGATLRFVSSFFPDWREDAASELVDFMRLDGGARVGNLSRGMRARLRLITAMAREAPLVLLDEPLAGIDPPSRSRILEAIISRYRPGEQTIVLSTHQVAEAESMFDEVAMMSDGRIRLVGDPEALRRERGKSVEELLDEEDGA